MRNAPLHRLVCVLLLLSAACSEGRDRPGPDAGVDAGVSDVVVMDAEAPYDSGFRTEPFDAGPIDALPQRTLLGLWVEVPPGTFLRGTPPEEFGHSADEPQYEVTLTRGYLMKVTEVTQGEWFEVMGTNPSVHPDCGLECPVDNVTWFDALRFTNALSAREGLAACYTIQGDEATFVGLDCAGYRLPTEAEWEYACRSGSNLASYSNGQYPPRTDEVCPEDPGASEVAWYCYNSDRRPHPVGGKPANAWGLLDMHGNADEWVWDWYGAGYYTFDSSRLDPLGSQHAPISGHRVARGGSFYTGGAITSCGNRDSGDPAYGNRGGGFRPVRTLIP